MNIYLRKILKHDITHQISVTKEILSSFFLVNSENQSTNMIGKNSKVSGNVTFLLKTDPRFGGDIKKIINSEGNIKEGDILLFVKNKGVYNLEIISEKDERHRVFSSIMDIERHLIINIDDYKNLKQENKNILKNINISHNRIFFGAPGTGKSYMLNKEAKEYFGNNYERVTFHPSYMYGNFVGAFKPFPIILKNKDGSIKKDEDGNIKESITYEYVPGVLIRQLVKAYKNENINYLLIIEEINRSNIASVFGDIFQLLDRDSNGESEYEITTSRELQEFLKKELENVELSEKVKNKLGKDFSKIYLPNNFYIWATMNSADQGVMPMDTAFRRRWDFTYIGINDAVSEDFKKYRFKINSEETVNWNEFRMKLNEKLSLLNIPEDKLIGPYFVPKSILEGIDLDKLTEVIKNKVLMYLYEDAAKPYKSLLFAEGKFSTYSTVCKNFEENALALFKGNLDVKTELITSRQYNIPNNENETEQVAESKISYNE